MDEEDDIYDEGGVSGEEISRFISDILPDPDDGTQRICTHWVIIGEMIDTDGSPQIAYLSNAPSWRSKGYLHEVLDEMRKR